MHKSSNFSHGWALVGCLLLALAPQGCDKAEKPTTRAANVQPTEPDKPPASSAPAAHQQLAKEQLKEQFATHAPTSHSGATIQIFAKPGGETAPHALVIVGRKHVLLNGKVVARMRCQQQGRPCTKAQQEAGAPSTEIDVQPEDLEAIDGEVVIGGLRKAARTLKDVPVAIIADRQVLHAATIRTIATLLSVSARPIVAAVNREGRAVVVASQGPDQADSISKRTSEAIGLPDQVRRIALQVNGTKATTELTPAQRGGQVRRNNLHGDMGIAASRWANRMAEAYPEHNQIELELDAKTPYSEAVRLLDMLRDRCAQGSTEIDCRSRTKRYAHVRLGLLQPPVAEKPPKSPPKAPPGAISAEMLRGMGPHRARFIPEVPIPHELLQVNSRIQQMVPSMPSRPPDLRPNVGGPPNGPR